MRSLLLALAAAAALAGCKRADRAEGTTVENAWIRLAPVAGRPAAGYFTLHGGAEGTVLLGVSSGAVQRIELHDSMMSGGMMQMAPLPAVAVPARGTVEFRPGGKHAMLFGVDGSVKPGSSVSLHFAFKPGSAVDAQARVVAAGDPAPAAH